MPDYPDYTDAMQVIGSDIMIPMDIQGAYIMMPVDIQAQYLEYLDINIKAQTVGNILVDLKAQSVGNILVDIKAQSVGNLAVNIADAVTIDINIASITGGVTFNIGSVTGTVNVDITTQSIADFKINIDAQNVGVYLQPEWAALKILDKNFYAVNTVAAWEEYAKTDYEVTGGGDLYICGVSCVINPNTNTDYDHQLHFRVKVSDYSDTTEDVLVTFGGNGGGSVVLPKPIVIPDGHHLWSWIISNTNVPCTIGISTWGYQV